MLTDMMRFRLTVPNTPPGFSVGLQTDTNHRVDLKGSLAIAVEAMYLLTLLPWEGVLLENFPVAAGQIPEEIYFQPTAALDADEQMETQYMVLGLYIGGLTLAAQYHDLHYETTVDTKMRGKQLGLVYIRRRKEEREKIANGQINSTTSLLDGEAKPINSTVSTSHGFNSNSGSLSDPEEPDFKINYGFKGRHDVRDPRDILLAALDGIANAAQFSSDARVSQLKGTTDGRLRSNAEIEVQVVTRIDPRAIPLTYRYAARAMLLILRLMYLQNRYQAIEFELGYGLVRFAEGSVRRPRVRLEDGTLAAAIA